MHDRTGPRLPKWPFFVADAILLASAFIIFRRIAVPMSLWGAGLALLCIVGAGVFSVLPYVLEYLAFARVAEAEALSSVISQVQKIETVAADIATATSRWQTVQEAAEKTAATAREIADRMATEAKAFTEFMERANNAEKTTLRLEVDKFRRAEADWMQVLVRMLDHVYALHQGAVRSGQPKLIEQVGIFQNACRDAARRVGLAPFVPETAEPFNAEKHQLVDGNGKVPPEAVVEQTIATGYTYQGRIVRPALVKLQNGEEPHEP